MRIICLAVTCACALSGCYVRETASTSAVSVTSAEPRPLDTYPSTFYEGRNVHLYQGHWYYRDGERWTYYREEPPDLATRRLGFMPPTRGDRR